MHTTRHASRALLTALTVLLLCILVALTACQNNTGKPADTTGSDAADTTAPAGTAYKVTVQKDDGSPASDIIVKLWQGSTEVALKLVGPDGSVTFDVAPGDYTVTVESPSGAEFHYDKDAAILTEAAPALTVIIQTKATKTISFMAPSKPAGDDYRTIEALVISDGPNYITYNTGDYTYVVYTPTKEGVYEFSCPACPDFSYHGMPIMVNPNPVMVTEGGKVSIQVPATSIGEASVSSYVFRFDPADLGEGGCTFTVTRTGDIELTIHDLPYDVPTADKSFLKPTEAGTGTLTDLDVLDPTLTVVLGEDGYYHLGTADGPLVYLRLTSDSPYIEDFVKMCETDRIRAYFYNDDGSFNRKESYNSLIAEYAEFVNADGVIPMNEQLAYMVQNAGRHMGWWDFSAGSDIFGDLVIPVEQAWLFACAYYK